MTTAYERTSAPILMVGMISRTELTHHHEGIENETLLARRSGPVRMSVGGRHLLSFEFSRCKLLGD